MSRDKSAAPSQLLGYGRQYTLLTLRLLKARTGAFCSIEVLDDVAEVDQELTTLLQSKSALTTNPISNRSLSLWKTFAIWARQVEDASIDPAKTQFVIYVSRPLKGPIAESFSEAVATPSISAAIQSARTQLYDPQEPLPVDVAKHADLFFNASKTTQEVIVKNFRLVCSEQSPEDDLLETIRDHPVSPSRVNIIAAYLVGWVKDKADRFISNGQLANIGRDEFHGAYRAFCQKVDRQQLLPSIVPPPSQAEVEALVPKDVEELVPKADVFIQQLHLIQRSYDDQLEAAADFLRSRADRVAWAKSGDVDATSFADLEMTLKRAWKNESTRCEIDYAGRSDIDRGVSLLIACMKHSARVQGMDPPDHFIPGCFHELANDLTVGWHPKFKELLEEQKGI